MKKLFIVLFLIFTISCYTITLQEMYDSAEPGAGYDKMVILEPGETYTGGLFLEGPSSETIYHQSFDNSTSLPNDWIQYSYADSTSWHLNTSTASSQPNSLAHYHTTLTSDDWIVMPQLTLPENAYVVFKELNDASISSYYEHHGLWISTGSGNPTDGDFELVGEFIYYCSSWVWRGCDLAEYAYEDVYLAFHYEGFDESAWWIDDFYVSAYPEPFRTKIAGNGAIIDLDYSYLSVNSNMHWDIDRAIFINGPMGVMYHYSAKGLITNCVFYDMVRGIMQASISEVTCYNSIFSDLTFAIHKSLPENPIHLSYNCMWNNDYNYWADKPC
jgi:hypothetical protein